ncbi:MAG TPA: hypothetical protein VEC57_10645 [Candidatus Limnocylindrales bacterium]|nr:hypothetical protein [Candidatus Limnocylindrales bacterium]
MTKAAVAALLVVYPLLMWAALRQASPRAVATLVVGVVVAVVAAAAVRSRDLLPLVLRRFGVLAVLAVAAVAFNDPLALKLLPVFTHVWLLYVFGSSLLDGPSLVEQLARRAHGGIFPDFLVPYTRKVTIVWCTFFCANVVIYAWLAVAAPTGTWAFYTGFGCYVLTFALAAGEYVHRKVRFRYYEDGWADRIWRRLLPPEGSDVGRRILEWKAATRSKATSERDAAAAS